MTGRLCFAVGPGKDCTSGWEDCCAHEFLAVSPKESSSNHHFSRAFAVSFSEKIYIYSLVGSLGVKNLQTDDMMLRPIGLPEVPEGLWVGEQRGFRNSLEIELPAGKCANVGNGSPFFLRSDCSGFLMFSA